MILNSILLQSNGDAGIMNFGLIILLFVVFYFFMIRPQQKKQKEIRKFRESLTVGDKIITAGGIHGKVRAVKENTFVVEIADGVKITIDKGSVYPSAADAQAAPTQEK
ncbi:MAG: preprotein translocase subunit YajC [Muribaculum sp.]|nr:preprotein translocase subunit YajC [Muribaculum sp.]